MSRGASFEYFAVGNVVYNKIYVSDANDIDGILRYFLRKIEAGQTHTNFPLGTGWEERELFFFLLFIDTPIFIKVDN